MKITMTSMGFVVHGLKVTPDSADTPFALRMITLLSDFADQEGLERPTLDITLGHSRPASEVVDALGKVGTP